jgi:hypothetical protein
LPAKRERRHLVVAAAAIRGHVAFRARTEGGLSNITGVAKKFFAACETGKSWEE